MQENLDKLKALEIIYGSKTKWLYLLFRKPVSHLELHLWKAKRSPNRQTKLKSDSNLSSTNLNDLQLYLENMDPELNLKSIVKYVAMQKQLGFSSLK